MKKKTFNGNEKKLCKIEKFYAHFGWKVESKEKGKMVLSFDKKIRNGKILKKLQKQAVIIRKKFPTNMIGWAIVAAIFLVLYFGLKDNVIFGVVDLKQILAFIPYEWLLSVSLDAVPILLLVIGGINAMFAIYQLFVFIILKCTSRTTLEEIYRNADALSGYIIDAPLRNNIAPDNESSGVLATIDINKI